MPWLRPDNPWVAFMAALVIFGALGALLAVAQRRAIRQRLLTVGDGGEGARSPLGGYLRSAAAPLVAVAANAAAPTLPPLAQLRVQERRHTVVAGSTGDGKTYTLFTLLLSAIRDGAQAIVCSPQYTDFHPEHQPINVRAVREAGHFEAYHRAEDTLAVLKAAAELVEYRENERYRKGLPVGHDVAIFIGEWSRIADRFGDEAIKPLRRVLESGRITHVWISYIEWHTALVGRSGGDSALREQFTTRLVGNVDDTTWRTFVGPGVPKRLIPREWWMTAQGMTELVGYTTTEITELAQRPPRRFPPLLTLSVPQTEFRPAFRAPAAVQADVPAVPDVPVVPEPLVSELEAVRIALELAKGNAPSAIAKGLPGYSAREYAHFKAKVEHVQGLLAQLGPVASPEDEVPTLAALVND